VAEGLNEFPNPNKPPRCFRNSCASVGLDCDSRVTRN
jgi:hypothetical protein